MQAALKILGQDQAQAQPTSEVRLAAATVQEEEKSGVHRLPVPIVTASSSVDAQLPMKLSHKWVAFACRTANVGKPRWNRVTRVWTTSVMGESGVHETISIKAAEDMMSVRVVVEWKAPAGSSEDTSTGHRLATAFVTCMRDGMRRRTMMRTSYEHARILSSLRSSHETR